MSTVSLLTPIGTGIASNSSPSLTPLDGALGVDSTQAGVLYIGNGSLWQNVSNVTATSTSVSVTLTATSQPNITGTLYLTSLTVGSIPQVMFHLVVNSAVSVAANSNLTWTMASAISSPYLPSINCYYGFPVTILSTVSVGLAYLEITTAGTINLGLATSGTNVIINNISGNYYV